jgi:hypothetical protein
MYTPYRIAVLVFFTGENWLQGWINVVEHIYGYSKHTTAVPLV